MEMRNKSFSGIFLLNYIGIKLNEGVGIETSFYRGDSGIPVKFIMHCNTINSFDYASKVDDMIQKNSVARNHTELSELTRFRLMFQTFLGGNTSDMVMENSEIKIGSKMYQMRVIRMDEENIC